ncbi:serine aminopeptidase domain-containing protein [Oceaniferula spumae]|uniref:serine aminopeptidase domain-containing protein n=1 Tax=Oceaniferula spumae TaxID=2979115 RepID=UPI003F4E4E54
MCRVAACLTLAALSSCANPIAVNPIRKVMPKLEEKQYVTYDGDRLGYNKWLPEKEEPQTVIIGVHGISGHSGDYDNFAKYLLKNSKSTALYAAETRGQGLDPKVERRGDIRRVKEWYKDLYTFTQLVRKVHPKAKVIWFGESMGSLIVVNAYTNAPRGMPKPDALIVSSPIIDVQAKLAPWKILAVRISTFLMPTLRISLESLSNGERAVVTQDDIHEEQAAKNAWYIPRYTLRLLLKLGDLAEIMPRQAEAVDCPILVLHGGKDIFTSEDSVKNFYEHLPETTPKARKYYPRSYHLLMYDAHRQTIFKDTVDWIKKLK